MNFIQAKVFHSRTETAKNSFSYPVLNVFFNIDQLSALNLLFKKKYLGLLSVAPESDGKRIVSERFGYSAEEVFLQTIPKMFGYVFNPVSFWYFYKSGNLDAVLCDVNNTFGEKHYYWLYQNGRSLNNVWLSAKKEFHVSPFFEVGGEYHFKFVQSSSAVEAHIRYLNADGTVKLITWIKGESKPADELSLAQIVCSYGWLTPLVIARIHFQALKLYFKKVRFFSKPEPSANRITQGR